MTSGLKFHVSKWLVSSAVASMLAMSVLALSSSTIFAAACDPAGTPLDASGGSASCDMTVTAQVNPGVLTLLNDDTATVSGTPFTLNGSAINGTFTFTSVVKDHTGSANGWSLQASSAGLVNGSTTIAINLSTLNVSSSCTNGTCPATTFSSLIPVTTTPTTFLQAGNTGHTTVVDGDYTNKTNGTFSIPAGSIPGSYSGTVTITLTNTF